MGFLKTKKAKSAEERYEEARDSRDNRRTRLPESTDVEHLHMQLLKAGEQIEELRAALERKKVDEGIARSLLSVAERESESVLDSAGGPVRRLRKKISRLNIRIRELSGDIVCTTDEDDVADNDATIDNSFSSSDEDDTDDKKMCRRRPEQLSYKKKAGQDVAADKVADTNYKQQKLVDFEDAVDKIFNNAISKPGS
jgi:hypothetical protein